MGLLKYISVIVLGFYATLAFGAHGNPPIFLGQHKQKLHKVVPVISQHGPVVSQHGPVVTEFKNQKR